VSQEAFFIPIYLYPLICHKLDQWCQISCEL